MNETTLPECSTFSVCSKIDTYDKPWVEKQCRCPEHAGECSTSTLSNDGHTITDKTRHYKVYITLPFYFTVCMFYQTLMAY